MCNFATFLSFSWLWPVAVLHFCDFPKQNVVEFRLYFLKEEGEVEIYYEKAKLSFLTTTVYCRIWVMASR